MARIELVNSKIIHYLKRSDTFYLPVFRELEDGLSGLHIPLPNSLIFSDPLRRFWETISDDVYLYARNRIKS